LFSKLKGQGPALASTILSALLPQIPLHVPVCVLVADWIEGYSLALFAYNSLSAGQARALRDGDQIVRYLRDALAAFPEVERRRVKIVRWQEMVGGDPSYHEETAALQSYLRSDEGRHVNQILQGMAAQFVQARQGLRTLKEGRIQYAEEYLQSEVVVLMRGLRGTDFHHQPCHYQTLYHPILAMQHDAECAAIGKFQEIFQHLVASSSLSRYFKPADLAFNCDLELEPREDGTFTTRSRPWATTTLPRAPIPLIP
jgi:predicted metal-dependent hydrolase